MKVRCILVRRPPPDQVDPDSGRVARSHLHFPDITVGRIYEVVRRERFLGMKPGYVVVNDAEDRVWYPDDFFEIVER